MAQLALVVALAGCPTTEKHESHEAPRTPPSAPAQDSPPPAWATEEAPDFADPKPPVPAASKGTREVESTGDRLLHNDNR